MIFSRIIKALFLYCNSQYYVIVNLQNRFLVRKKLSQKKNIILQKSFQYIVRYVTSDICSIEQLFQLYQFQTKQSMYNTVYMYYVKLLNKNVTGVISLIKRMFSCLNLFVYFTLVFNCIPIRFMANSIFLGIQLFVNK